MDYDSLAEELQDHADAPLLCPDRYHADNYPFCRWATSVTGFDVNSGKFVLVAVTCKRWGCPWCAEKKIRRLAWMTRNAEPSRLLTVTISDRRYPTPEAGWKGMSEAYPELIRWARKNWGECEYLRVLELQKNGTPHFHCLLKSPFILDTQMRSEWRRLIGVPEAPDESPDAPRYYAGLELRRIDKSFGTFHYLMKYLTKLHKIPWTDRHVSYSKNFFRAEDKEQVEYAKLDHIEKYDQHPWVWLNERYAWEQIRVLDHTRWELPGDIQDKQFTCAPHKLGLPDAHAPEPPKPLKQRMVPGIEDRDAADDGDHLRPDGRKRARSKRVNPAKQTAGVTSSSAVPYVHDDF